ncbi:MAG TPA: anthranilate synthase component I family protein [Actinomycetota bacterium]|nr:anthranilate synthase component I family protein [Actinomycetota bacterium]
MNLRVRPDLSEFRSLAARWPLVPVWAELMGDTVTPVGVFPSLVGPGPGALLESVERSERWGRYSFVSGDPAALVVVDARGLRVEDQVRDLPLPASPAPGPALGLLRSVAAGLRAPRLPKLPPLTGGLVGFLAYEAATLLCGYPCPGGPELPCPPVCLQVVDRAVVFDHWRQRILLVTHVPGGGRHAYLRGVEALEDLAGRVRRARPLSLDPLPGDGSPPVPWSTNMPDERYQEVVRRLKEHVAAGDIFQAVPSRRLTFPAPEGGFPVYRRLRVVNPSPYMFFLRMAGVELAGSSPEPLVRVEGKRVLTRPIAGTRPRGEDEEEDRRLERELLADPKERAEHAMLVDLARNDLGQVCRPGTVRPTELMVVERFSRVMHIVSTVEGELEEGLDPLDALAAAFPAGTVTGAPKERAMELIAELEPTPRGPYSGAAGYLSFAGDLDFCIAIRTAVVEGGLAHVQVGAGVVADSDPERELAETRAKASALALALVRPGTDGEEP